jgi:hypothetical protein
LDLGNIRLFGYGSREVLDEALDKVFGGEDLS